MSKQSLAHQNLEWAKQKLDEIDATLASLEDSVETIKSDARKEADRAIARIQAARNTVKAQVDAASAEAMAVKGIADDAYVALEAQWAEVDSAFQAFLTAAAGQADIVKKALAARAEAHRRAWQTSLEGIRAVASDAIDQARGEVDAAFRRLAAETEKAQAKLGQFSTAGDESWKAIKNGLEETRSVYERTWKKITDALTKVG